MTTTKNNKYILKEKEISEIRDLIHNGFGTKYIKSHNSFGLKSNRVIKSISDNLGIRHILKKNNYNNTKRQVSHFAKERRDKKIKYYHERFSLKILNLVNNEHYTPNDIQKKFNIPIKMVQNLIERLNIKVKCQENSKLKLKLTARKNGRLSSLKLKGVELKPITKEISDRFIELKNSKMFKKDICERLYKEFGFRYKKYYQLCKKHGKPDENPQTGKLNPMYGKSPSPGSGIGAKCWILYGGKKIFCRSSLELKIYCYLIDNNIEFEISKHRIKYKFNGIERTYNPDIVIEETICEIKPSNMVRHNINTIKHNALEKYCEEYNLSSKILTEQTQDLTKYDSIDYIDNLIKKGNLIIDEKNLDKVKKYIGKYEYNRN